MKINKGDMCLTLLFLFVLQDSLTKCGIRGRQLIDMMNNIGDIKSPMARIESFKKQFLISTIE